MKFVVGSAKQIGLVFGRARARKRRKGICDICGRTRYVVSMVRQVPGVETLDMCSTCRREGY